MRSIACIAVTWLVTILLLPTVGVSADPPLQVILVRHAEKESTGRDPELSEAGKLRAAVLSRMLNDAKLSQIHSTDFARTRDTAAPIAARFKLKVSTYDPRDLKGLADALRKKGGRHLVVGHSNTTPALVKLLGGDSGTAIQETEYDRLYVVNVDEKDKTTTLLIRFGE